MSEEAVLPVTDPTPSLEKQPEFLTTTGLARRVPFEPQTLRAWRLSGRGPAFIKLDGANGRCIYRWADVEAWLAERSHRSTAELRAPAPTHRGRKPRAAR